MLDFLSTWPPGMVIALVSVVGGCLTAIVWGIAIFWSWTRRVEIAVSLKRDLIQRGLSVEEIERLVREPAVNDKPTNERQLDASLASLLVQYEVSAPTMEQVVRTFQAAD